MAPPSCRLAFTRPEANPAFCGATPAVAANVPAGKLKPSPRAAIVIGPKMPDR